MLAEELGWGVGRGSSSSGRGGGFAVPAGQGPLGRLRAMEGGGGTPTSFGLRCVSGGLPGHQGPWGPRERSPGPGRGSLARLAAPAGDGAGSSEGGRPSLLGGPLFGAGGLFGGGVSAMARSLSRELEGSMWGGAGAFDFLPPRPRSLFGDAPECGSAGLLGASLGAGLGAGLGLLGGGAGPGHGASKEPARDCAMRVRSARGSMALRFDPTGGCYANSIMDERLRRSGPDLDVAPGAGRAGPGASVAGDLSPDVGMLVAEKLVRRTGELFVYTHKPELQAMQWTRGHVISAGSAVAEAAGEEVMPRPKAARQAPRAEEPEEEDEDMQEDESEGDDQDEDEDEPAAPGEAGRQLRQATLPPWRGCPSSTAEAADGRVSAYAAFEAARLREMAPIGLEPAEARSIAADDWASLKPAERLRWHLAAAASLGLPEAQAAAALEAQEAGRVAAAALAAAAPLNSVATPSASASAATAPATASQASPARSEAVAAAAPPDAGHGEAAGASGSEAKAPELPPALPEGARKWPAPPPGFAEGLGLAAADSRAALAPRLRIGGTPLSLSLPIASGSQGSASASSIRAEAADAEPALRQKRPRLGC